MSIREKSLGSDRVKILRSEYKYPGNMQYLLKIFFRIKFYVTLVALFCVYHPPRRDFFPTRQVFYLFPVALITQYLSF
jgi:hypothetical protein